MTAVPRSVSFPALGSTALVAVSDSASLEAALAAVREEVDALDRSCSRFRDDSELSRLNRAAGGATVHVGPLLLEALREAIRAAQLTDGDVDPTIGGSLVALGYDRDFDSIDTVGQISFRAVPGWRSVELDAARSTVRLPRGVVLDLGATAKALGADRAARRAFEASACGVLVGLGGDFAIVGEAPPDGWPYPGDGRPPSGYTSTRSMDCALHRRPRHLEQRYAPLAGRLAGGPPSARPGFRAKLGGWVANRQRRGRDVP